MATVAFEKCSLTDHAASTAKNRVVFAEGIRATVHIDSKSTVIFDFMSQRENESVAEFAQRIPPEIRLNWLKELEAWLSGQEHTEGTPVDQMPWLTPAQVATLTGAGVVSVEKLADCSDGLLAPLGLNGSVLRSQARAWLDEAAGLAVASVGRLQQENDELRAMLLRQLEAISALQAQAEKKGAAPKQPKPAPEKPEGD